jgi:hypothetical protein
MQKAYPAANPEGSIVSRRDPATIQRALSHIPAQDRDMWLRMGMAVKSGLGEDGFGLWDTWSRTADNYNASDARAVWRSIKPNGGISIGTLFHTAKLHGFRSPESALKRDLAEGNPRKKEAPEKGQWTPLVPVPPEAPPPLMAHRKRGKPSCLWTYRDPKGGVLCHVARFDIIQRGKPGKVLLPLTYCRSTASGKAAWRWQALPAPRPLYNLDKLTAHPDAPVILAEGEKGADAAAILFPERVATTTLNGAQSPHCTDFSPLKGCSVWIFPDHDVAGR